MHFFPEIFRFWNSHREEVHFFLEEVHFFMWSLPKKVHFFQEDGFELSFLEQPSGQQYPLLGFKLYNFLNELFNLEHCMTGYDIYNKPISRQTTERAKEMSRCLKIPAVVLPGNLASPCTANQPISESLSSIL